MSSQKYRLFPLAIGEAQKMSVAAEGEEKQSRTVE
jgi:hypothetical protein